MHKLHTYRVMVNSRNRKKEKTYISLHPLVVKTLWVRMSVGIGGGDKGNFSSKKILDNWAVSSS